MYVQCALLKGLFFQIKKKLKLKYFSVMDVLEQKIGSRSCALN